MYNANNYGYNPYGYTPQRPVQPMQQPMQYSTELQRTGLNGKQVDSIDVVKATDIGFDGINYFPLIDGSAIFTKQITNDGTSKIIVYKPVIEEEKEKIKYLTDEDLEDIKEEIKDIKKTLKDIKKKGE